MRKQFPDLPTWHFDMDEVSAGVYEVIGSDGLGHVVRAKGTDLELLVEQCRREATLYALQKSRSIE
jgi:hypothetical protein